MKTLALAAPRSTERRDVLIAALHAELDIDTLVTEDGRAADLDHAYDRLDAAIARLDALRRPNDPGGIELAAEIGRAEDGDVPLWFQRGTFLAACDGLRAVVDTDLGPGRGMGVMTLHALDLDAPFVASTADVRRVYFGHANASPLAVARSWLRNAARSGIATELAPNQVTLPPLSRWPWLAKSMPEQTLPQRAQLTLAV